MIITLCIILITSFVSISAFSNQHTVQRLIFSPYAIKRNKEWYRFITYGFIHANWIHLLFNMWVLYLFGNITESYFKHVFGIAGGITYLFMYMAGMILSEMYSFFRHQDNPGYMSLGASGAVSAVLFASILFKPLQKLYIIFLPIGIPGFIFGLLYLLYSWYMARQARDNIGHYAHFFGAVFGFLFPILMKPALFIEFIQGIAYGF
ncbi:MAG: rhomboid family intramembrane serine protease [Chitinophagales bacterium]|nr:MAG: rhomboid family intramembrane serine protease [Chitinophagales bacterium]